MVNRKRSSAVHWQIVAVCFISLFLSATVYAHGSQQHVMGTVKTIGADSITVESATHQMQTVSVTGQTKFIKSGNPSSLSQLKTGDRVVIHAKPSGKTLEATEVKFEAAPANSAGKSTH